MTDEQIIKALECLAYWGECKQSSQCPYYMDNDIVGGCDNVTIAKEALDLINQQEAEIEKLNHEILSCNTEIEVLQKVKEQLEKDVFYAQMNCDSIAYKYELLKQEKSVVQSEAIKEFAERLKDTYENDKRYDRPDAHTTLYKLFDNIDNLVTELTESE